jgi:hypothetical protein
MGETKSLVHIVAAVTLDHTVAKMTLDAIIAFYSIVAFVIPLFALWIS